MPSALPIGSVRLFNGIYYIKVCSGGDRNHKPWRAYERWLWEQIHGPIPKGYHIKHIDGNRFNTAVNNLALTSFGWEESVRMRNPAYSFSKKLRISQAMLRFWSEGPKLPDGHLRIRECSDCAYESKELLRCPKCNSCSFVIYSQKRAS